MAHSELNLRERRAIEDMLNAKMSVDKIAAEIRRHRSTLYREIKRNRFVDDELPNLNVRHMRDVERRQLYETAIIFEVSVQTIRRA